MDPAVLTREQGIEKLRALAEGSSPAPSSVPVAPAAPTGAVAATPTPPHVPAPGTASEKPVATDPAAAPDATAKAAEPSAPPAATTPSRWKRKIKVMDEERAVDLESMSEQDLDALLGKGLAHETVKERLRASRDEAKEALPTERRRAVEERDQLWRTTLVPLLAERNLKIEADSAGRLKLVEAAPKTQGALQAQSGQAIDLDALEQKAIKENTVGAFLEYARAIRHASAGALTDAQVLAIMDSRLAERDQGAAAERDYQAKVADCSRKLDSAMTARKGDFDRAGASADVYRRKAVELALAVSKDPEAKVERVIQQIHDMADLARDSVAIGQKALAVDPTKPRPKAPTVVSSGAPPAAQPANPAAFDTKTPEGKAKAIDWLRANDPTARRVAV